MNINLFSITRFFLQPRTIEKVYLVIIIALLQISLTAMVYMTGGTKNAYVHALYLSILLGGTSFSIKGGLIAGATAAFLVGPFMPSDVVAHISQSTTGWLWRLFFFLLVGGFSGYSAFIFKSYLKEIETKLTTDPITGLLNLKGLSNFFTNEVSLDKSQQFSIVMVLVDHLREISLALGQDATEELLRLIRDQLRPIVDSFAKLTHLETENFCLLVYDSQNTTKVVELCKNTINNEYIIKDIPIFAEFFYGIGYKEEQDTLLSVLRKAKIAAEHAREKSQPQTTYDSKTDSFSQRNIKIIRDISRAINEDKLQLYYQPKIDLHNMSVVGIEALGRWNHPELGFISPNEFIPLIEQTLLINNYTRWMIDNSLRQLAFWHKKGLYLSLSLNFSMKNFYDVRILEAMHDGYKKYGIPLNMLEIEITERSVSSNIKQIADILSSLRQTGIKIIVDDFGTGQSSLQYLFELPVDSIKIDPLFTKSMMSNSAAEAIVRSAVLLAHELNLKTIAEGIETDPELHKIKSIGCDYAQGYLFAKPMASDFATQWLELKMLAKSSAQ
jgi:EAL domain-containing protein (putative c-di-GMP-specific phosphodiesterase class I)/GGDEF domain-containing protein